jgi:hypothetical protein
MVRAFSPILRYNLHTPACAENMKLTKPVAMILLALWAVLSASAPARVAAQDAATGQVPTLPPAAAEGVSTPPTAPTAAPVGIPPLTPLSAPVPQPTSIQLIDRPSDDGSALLLLFELPVADGEHPAIPGGPLVANELTRVNAEVLIDADGKQEWRECQFRPLRYDTLSTVADQPEYFGWGESREDATHKYPPQARVLVVDRYIIPGKDSEFETAELTIGQEYAVRLVVRQDSAEQRFDAGKAVLRQSLFNFAAMNNLVFCVVFALIILGFILAARKNPNLFIRRIQGLEAVDEAIGRATEMGKPVLHVNGLDPLSTLATLAAVNILGRIARRVANYESTLLVPCFDPVVMTVSQEVVRNAYLEAGRPDAYREDNIFFLTDQQFSYTASTCGIMVREKPAAIFLLGYFYAEALMLAETGFSVGAIQIAGTDAQAQLPFFITTCDYTLIGEELYAASAYLSREPMLLGSLKGQDVGKAFVMVIIVIGTLLATLGILSASYHFGQGINWDWLTQLLTPLV